MFNKTIDNVLAVFNKAVSDLDKIIATQTEKIKVANIAIDVANEQRKEATDTAFRAATVKAKIQQLISE